ncbi:MAG: methyl-accepting chemotaxis protein [Methyloprofundus sp.]|nr:MAG: methyl-accepting chemotaxis protein [Methyloprofundus sp.]
MKVNMPVTDHEVMMKEGTILVTRTNLKGIITYANDAFVEISGFSLDELVGTNHNVVRHPDMPAVAFQDLWESIKDLRPWNQLVKNRTKSGDYYWVEAHVTPTYKNGIPHEYLSVRYAPSRTQINEAESLYRQLNASRATTIRPTGMAKAVLAIKEMSPNKKAIIAATAFLLPNAWLMKQLFDNQQMLPLAIVAALATLAVVVGFKLVSDLTGALKSATNTCYQMTDENFRNIMPIDRNDVVGGFYRALYGMQVKLNADLSYAKQIGNESLRIKQALDNVSSCVMVANNNLDIIYMNNTVTDMFTDAEQQIQQQLPNFDASKLLGANIDQFHKNPAHQRGLLQHLDSTFSSELIIGGLTMGFVANPVLDDQGTRTGIVVEWLNRTHEVKIEQEIAELVSSVQQGNLSSRIETADKDGFFLKLSEGINDLTDGIEAVFSDVNSAMQSLAQGDLSNHITNDYAGVYGDCKNNINSTIEKLGSIVGQVRESSDFINNASQEIASGNNNLSERVETQASSLQETASSMEELTSTVKNNADNAQQANQIASTARTLAEKGGTVVTSAVNAMAEINESSNKIAEIIGVIDEIAFQTNLLALNASVEAARAGEQGRGFSVVATEVRNLAQRSATAARESKELIQTSIQRVRSGTEFVNETGTALNEIVGGVKKVGDIISEIAAASIEQSQGIEQVNQAVSQMDEITQQNAALAEEASAASVSMSDQSNNMTSLLGFFSAGGAGNIASAAPMATAPISPVPAKPTISKPQAQAMASKSFVATGEDDEWDEF